MRSRAPWRTTHKLSNLLCKWNRIVRWQEAAVFHWHRNALYLRIHTIWPSCLQRINWLKQIMKLYRCHPWVYLSLKVNTSQKYAHNRTKLSLRNTDKVNHIVMYQQSLTKKISVCSKNWRVYTNLESFKSSTKWAVNKS